MRWTWDAQELWIDPARLAAGRATKFDGTVGNDRIVGTDGRDRFDVSQGGDDTLRGKGDNDTFNFLGAFTPEDRINGGDGRDKLVIGGDYPSMIELDPAHIKSVERFDFIGERSYNVKLLDGLGDSLVLSKNAQLFVDASGLTHNTVKVIGGGFSDHIIGGSGSDTLWGAGSGDNLTGGLGQDKFVYKSQVDSTDKFGNSPDTITDFEHGDSIELPSSVASYHVGMTDGHIGDVLASYDAKQDVTNLSVYLDQDVVVDLKIVLLGDCHDIVITSSNLVELVG